jgi:hypothetical protein
MHIGRRNQSPQSGGALFASLVVVVIVAAVGASLVQLQSALTRRHVSSVDRRRAFYVAEAGLAEAFAAISAGKSGAVGTADEPAAFGDGVFWVEAQEDDEGRVTLDSTGLCGTGRFSIAVVVQREINQVGAAGVFGDEAVEVGPGAVVDGYDSRAGTYADQVDPADADGTTGGGARLASNGDIAVQGDLSPAAAATTRVLGDVQPGPEGLLDMDPGVSISGATTPLTAPLTLPPLTIPALEGAPETLTCRSGAALTVSGDDAHYDRLGVARRGTLVLAGPLRVVVDHLLLEPGAQLVIDTTDGPVELFVTETLRMRAGSTLANVGADPSRVAVYLGALGFDTDALAAGVVQPKLGLGAEPALVLEAGGEFYGLLYAPFNELTLPTGLRFYGALAADSVVLDSDSRVSYDAALVAQSLSLETEPRLLSWQVSDLPDTGLVKSGMDPLATLALSGTVPLASATAHRERELEMRYTDTGGVLRTYAGPVDTFDWSNAQQVLAVRWKDPVSGLLSPETILQGSLRSGSGYDLLLPIAD